MIFVGDPEEFLIKTSPSPRPVCRIDDDSFDLMGSNPEKEEIVENEVIRPYFDLSNDLLTVNKRVKETSCFQNFSNLPNSIPNNQQDESGLTNDQLCNSQDVIKLQEDGRIRFDQVHVSSKKLVTQRILTRSYEEIRSDYFGSLDDKVIAENVGELKRLDNKRCSSAIELRNWIPFLDNEKTDITSPCSNKTDFSCKNLDNIQNGVISNNVNIELENFGTKCNDNIVIKEEIKQEEYTEEKINHFNNIKNNSHYTNNQRNDKEIEDQKVDTKEVKNSLHHDDKSDKHKSSHRSRDDKRSSSDYRCSHCKRRKTKYTNQGIQCRRDHDTSNRHLRRLSPSTKLLPSGNSTTHPSNRKLKYRKYMHIEEHSNGGALVLHMYHKEISHLSKEQMRELATEFFQVAFAEDENNHADFVMAIVHGAAAYLPDLLEYMTLHHPQLTVKNGVLGRSSDIETCTISQYYEQVHKHYQNGTVRYGPLHQVSLAGVAHEEVGGYFPDLLDKLEENPFLDMVNINKIKPMFFIIRFHFL